MVLRTSEWINLFFFTFFLVLAWLRPSSTRRRLEICAIGVAGIGLTFAGAYGSYWLPASVAPVFRDLLPALLMLFVYWQSGRFYVKPNEWVQNSLLRLDDRLIGSIMRQLNQENRSWIINYLEFSYLLCYPLVPLGVGVLYAAELRSHVNYYWSIVILSTYLCYLPLPFIQMLPPRMLTSEAGQKPNLPILRILNLGILKHASIQVNTFPSAHLASTMAASLVLLSFVPMVGVMYLLLTLSIAGGAVLGRYHYAADVVLGILSAGVVYLLEACI